MRNTLLMLLLVAAISGFGQETANFTFDSIGGFCAPASIRFRQLCPGSPERFLWQSSLGNYTEPNPVVLFPSPGDYTITLTALYEKTALSITKIITILPALTLNIVPDRAYLCQPGNVTFTSSTNGFGNSYNWNFGDSTLVTDGPSVASHYFENMRNYNVVVVAKSAAGCVATKKLPFSIAPIRVSGTSSQLSGCTPAAIRLNVKATLPDNSSVVNYEWNFYDSTPVVNSATGNISKTITRDGKFVPAVTLTTNEGCVTTYTFAQHQFGAKPGVVIPMSNNTVFCASDTILFYTNSTNATEYNWKIGSSAAVSTTDTFVKYSFNELGRRNVLLTPVNYGCKGVQQPISIKLVGVVAKLDLENSCNNKNNFQFTSASLGNVTSLRWDFNGLVPGDSVRSIRRTFPSPVAAEASLIVGDSITGCMSQEAAPVFTTIPMLTSVSDTICKYSTGIFRFSNDYYAASWKYSWRLLGRTYNGDSAITKPITADSAGTFNNLVIAVYGKGYCPDTVYAAKPVVVRSPELNMRTSKNLCLSDSLQVTNLSRSFAALNDSLTWRWDFGDNAGSSNSFDPGSYKYDRSGNYAIKLFASDSKGCYDSIVHKVAISANPFLKIITANDQVCKGGLAKLIAIHSDSLSWHPTAIVDCVSCDTLKFQPQESMVVNVLSTSGTCIVSDSLYIKVINPFVASVKDTAYNFCNKDTVLLSAAPIGNIISWEPSASILNPNAFGTVAYPLATTVYTATIRDSSNCFSSTAKVTAYLNAPATVEAGPDKFYLAGSSFTINPSYSQNIVFVEWSPSALLSCNDCGSPSGILEKTTLFTVIATSDSGCVATDSIRISVQCSEATLYVPTAFTPNSDGLNDLFRPLVKGIQLIKRFAVYNRFGQLVFNAQTFDPANNAIGWNGKYKGFEAPAGTYQYVLEAECEMGEHISKKGSFVLMK